MPVPAHDIKLLWGKAGGRCSFENCENEVIDYIDDGVLGQVAHIRAQSPGGPRYDPTYPVSNIDRYRNLILLCRHHHGVVDIVDSRYSVSDLLTVKANHEARISEALARGLTWSLPIAQIEYVNVPRILTLAAIAGLSIEIPELKSERTTLNKLAYDLNYVLHRIEKLLRMMKIRAISLEAALDSRDAVRSLVEFNATFRTKNVPAPHAVTDDWRPHGDLKHDPHIYTGMPPRRMYCSLDPRYITHMTAFSDFRSGIIRFAGLAMVKRSVADTGIYCSPLVIGVPLSNLTTAHALTRDRLIIAPMQLPDFQANTLGS